MSRLRGRLPWMVGAAALAVALAAGALLLSPATAGGSLDEARVRWNNRPFQAYQLSLSQETRRGDCAQQIAVADERAGQALDNSCGQPATWTVTRLFNWIAELEGTPAQCFPGPSMCACRGSTTTRVTYDPELGYPREIVYEWHKQPNLGRAVYWRSLFDQSFPGCDKDGTGGPVVVRIGLSPQP